jgi:hypothetical protein
MGISTSCCRISPLSTERVIGAMAVDGVEIAILNKVARISKLALLILERVA